MNAPAKTVLVVDDDPDVRDTLRLVLQHAGYRVVTAASGEEGLRGAAATDPDAVIVDLMMEEVDAGLEFVKSLRLRGAEAPVFMLSSVGNALSSTVDYAALGLAAVLQKPVEPSTLVTILRTRLED